MRKEWDYLVRHIVRTEEVWLLAIFQCFRVMCIVRKCLTSYESLLNICIQTFQIKMTPAKITTIICRKSPRHTDKTLLHRNQPRTFICPGNEHPKYHTLGMGDGERWGKGASKWVFQAYIITSTADTLLFFKIDEFCRCTLWPAPHITLFYFEGAGAGY